MNVSMGIFRKTVQKYNKCFYIWPEVFFNFKKEHWRSSVAEDIIEDDEMIDQEMKFKFITCSISFQQPLNISKMIKVFIEIFFCYCLRIFIMFNSK